MSYNIPLVDYTGDVTANAPTPCGRCETTIQVGEVKHYLEGRNGVAKFVCGRCKQHYDQKPGTVIRKTAQKPPHVDPEGVRHRVNAAQRHDSTYNMRNVTPIVPSQPAVVQQYQTYPIMGPAAPSGRQQSMIPNIAVPSSWQQMPASQSSIHWGSAQSQSQPRIHHPDYEKYRQEREKMIQKTYKDKDLEKLNLALQVCREVPGKTKPALVSNIYEGKNDVAAQITAKELQDLVLDQMRPRLEEATQNFPFDWNCELTKHAVVVRELDSWVDLKMVNPTKPYLYDRCFVEPRGKNNTGRKVFKRPGKPFNFALVISCEEWDRYTSHLEQEDFNSFEYSRHKEDSDSNQDSNSMQASTYKTRVADSVASWNTSTANRETAYRTQVIHNVVHSLKTVPTTKSIKGNTSNKPLTVSDKSGSVVSSSASLATTSKRQRSPEIYEPTEQWKPAKRPVTMPVYRSPDREKIKSALLKGGAFASLNAKAFTGTLEHIEFCVIIERPFDDLLNGPQLQTFQYESTNTRPGTLYTRYEEQIGAGTFKTAHPGQLSLLPPLNSGLGCSPNENVVVKRMFFKTEIKGKKKQTERDTDMEAQYKIQQYVFNDELDRVLVEANMLYWGSSLMSLGYAFIISYLATQPQRPEFEIPQLRFVKAGVAVSHDRKGAQKISGGAPKGTELKRAYLLEEYIDEKDEFVKYISNGSAVPCLDIDHPLYNIAEFLSFIQHVQYSKTGGIVYVSDFQGGKELLTDPQIMTSPSLSDGVGLFGDGNVPEAFEAFPKEHKCNLFCNWFQLTSLAPEDGVEVG
ncbi:hypothetical protein H0H93_010410 [Arthromyces matolae]|nr:hypothetical protein H0H93_010410 [Arthromyces matolae]